MVSFMKKNFELEVLLGKKLIDLVFLKLMSGFEIIDLFCDLCDLDKNFIFYLFSVVLIEF